MKKNLLLALLPLLAACVAPKVAINQNADFSTVKRVAVLPFGGDRGGMAADLLTQSLLMSGADVIERQRLSAVMQEHQLSDSPYFDQATAKKLGRLLGVDALFVGTVAESQAAGRYLVNTGNTALVSDVTKVGNATIHSEGSVAGLPNSQVLSTTAHATLMARMVDVQSGSVLWAASMSYEGFDLASAMAAITDAFTDSLKSIWPALSRTRPG
jgi:curli biogenesis system outer membrane secretion channel CsgG